MNESMKTYGALYDRLQTYGEKQNMWGEKYEKGCSIWFNFLLVLTFITRE